MDRVRIGNVEIQPILDTPVLMNPHQFLPKHAEAFLREFADLVVDPRGLFQMSITCFLLRSAGKTILVDTGLGPWRRPGFPRGHLNEALAEHGIAPGDIDLVVNTHLHIDHTGWNTVEGPDGQPTIFFTNARWLVQKVEWEYWMQPRFMEDPSHPHLSQCVAPLEREGRVEFVYSEQAIDENLVFVPSPGHTPGHVCIGIQSAGERGVIIGDASHHPAQLIHPDWSPSADADPMLSARTREKLFEDAIQEGYPFIAGHWPFPGMGRIHRVEGKRVFRAL
jgi:glyoxylase-like metal-dependent hydrolase (beta-lactamase superfamily II)